MDDGINHIIMIYDDEQMIMIIDGEILQLIIRDSDHVQQDIMYHHKKN